MICTVDTKVLNAEGLNIAFLLAMQDIGLISGVDGLGFSKTWHSMNTDRYSAVLLSHNKALWVTDDDMSKQCQLTGYLLTAIGQQILSLGMFEPHIDYMRTVGHAIRAQGFSVLLGSHMIDPEKGLIIFDQEPLL